MSINIRKKVSIFCLMVVVYNNILVESKIQFVNDDDSSILFNYNDSFLSKQFATVVTVDGSGLTCKNYEGFYRQGLSLIF